MNIAFWRRKQEPQPPELPEPPTGVRVIYRDGLEEPCELRYDGFTHGFHRWVIVDPIWKPGVSHIYVETLPCHTSIQFEVIR